MEAGRPYKMKVLKRAEDVVGLVCRVWLTGA